MESKEEIDRVLDEPAHEPTPEELFAEAVSKPEPEHSDARKALDARRASGGISVEEYAAALKAL
jgi:hypothetical protein